MGEYTPTFSLFARPSFIEGVARLIDMGATLDSYNTSPTPEEVDRRALAGDVAAVAHDFRQVLEVEARHVEEQSPAAARS